jgi:adenylyl-sulfate kinase
MSPRVLWLYGLPCSGKTTLSRAVAAALRAENRPVCVLDGDELRAGLCADLGFSDADRAENLRRAAHVARLLAAQGFTVIAAFVTPRENHREIVRGILGKDARLVHVACALAVCEARDVKGLYHRARQQTLDDMTGVQAPFEPPSTDAPQVRTDEGTIESACAELMRMI